MQVQAALIKAGLQPAADIAEAERFQDMAIKIGELTAAWRRAFKRFVSAPTAVQMGHAHADMSAVFRALHALDDDAACDAMERLTEEQRVALSGLAV